MDAWEYLPGSSGDAWERMCGTSGDAWERLAGTVGDAWERLIVPCGIVVINFLQTARGKLFMFVAGHRRKYWRGNKW